MVKTSISLAASCLTVILLFGCAQAVKTSRVLSYKYAFATPSCAPWDGAATHIVLQQKQPIHPDKTSQAGPSASYPHISIHLWMSNPPLNQWIPLSENRGSVSFCTAHSVCENRKSRIRFTVFSERVIEGELHETGDKDSQQELVYPFKATLYPSQVICG